MSVVGFDLGNHSCYIALARQGGIEVITNDYSLHATPSCVSFGQKNRLMGFAAKQQMNVNLKNSIINFKHLIGRKYTDEVAQQIKSYLPCEMIKLPDDYIGLKVTYLGETQVFTPEQVMTALLVKLKEITEQSNHQASKVTDCVVSIPFYFTDLQRRALLACCQMANLNCLRLLNETTAVALAYGIYKQDLPLEGEKSRIIAFVDIGHAASQAALVAFNKGKLAMLGSVYSLDVNGRCFDQLLREHFQKDFQTRFAIDTRSKPRAWSRLLEECEKLKKQMSANSTSIPINIECFVDDKDVNGKMQRSEFEKLASPQMEKFRALLQRLLKENKKKPADIESVELIGGSTRIPAIKKIVADVFHQDPRTTMNQDEAVARGCAMQCAILSPVFRVREFSIKDCQPFRIAVSWGLAANGSQGDENDVFVEHDEFPFSKLLTLFRNEPFCINANYSMPNQIPYPRTAIGSWKVTNLTANEQGESRKVKVKVRINPNGIFTVCSANYFETVTVPVIEEVKSVKKLEVPNLDQEMDNEQTDSKSYDKKSTENEMDEVKEVKNQEERSEKPIDVDSDMDKKQEEAKNNSEDCEKMDTSEVPKTKTKSIAINLPIEETNNSLYNDLKINQLRDEEWRMQKLDHCEKEKVDAKNFVEEYVYEMRSSLNGIYSEFIQQKDSETFQQFLNATEDWLYNEGEDADKNQYETRLKDLKKIGDPIHEKYVVANTPIPVETSAVKEPEVEQKMEQEHEKTTDNHEQAVKND